VAIFDTLNHHAGTQSEVVGIPGIAVQNITGLRNGGCSSWGDCQSDLIRYEHSHCFSFKLELQSCGVPLPLRYSGRPAIRLTKARNITGDISQYPRCTYCINIRAAEWRRMISDHGAVHNSMEGIIATLLGASANGNRELESRPPDG
jgi:hypothetical protein